MNEVENGIRFTVSGPVIKSIEEIDAIMARIDERSRYRWCGAEKGDCACLGCVQICSRSLMYEQTFSREHRGDPERIDMRYIPQRIRQACSVTREEWEAWKERHPELNPPQGSYRMECVAGEPMPVHVGSSDLKIPEGVYISTPVHLPRVEDIPVPGVPKWVETAARQIQAGMFEDWSLTTIARKIHEAYERKGG